MSKKAIIIGCGGHAHVVAETAILNDYNLLGFMDESFSGTEEYIYKARLIGKPDATKQYSPDEVFVFIAQGDNQKRRDTFHWLQKKGYRMPPLIHPKTLIANDVIIGDGSLICMAAKLAVEVAIGNGCIINTGVIVDHESRIGSFSHLAPGVIVAGRTNIENNVFIGMGARIADGKLIGSNVVIGAGSLILKNIDSGKNVLGVYH